MIPSYHACTPPRLLCPRQQKRALPRPSARRLGEGMLHAPLPPVGLSIRCRPAGLLRGTFRGALLSGPCWYHYSTPAASYARPCPMPPGIRPSHVHVPERVPSVPPGLLVHLLPFRFPVRVPSGYGSLQYLPEPVIPSHIPPCRMPGWAGTPQAGSTGPRRSRCLSRSAMPTGSTASHA